MKKIALLAGLAVFAVTGAQGADMDDAKKQDPRTVVYLASYKTEKAARAGFKTLSKASPILAKQDPILLNVDKGPKGQWVRLYGMAADLAEKAKICQQVGKLVDECGSQQRE